MLPEGWIKVSHNSGLPIYLHKVHRVCTLARPYFLGPGSVRKHEIPISAIPCLNYRRAVEKEAESRASIETNTNAENGEEQEKLNEENGSEKPNEQEETENVIQNGCENIESSNSSSDVQTEEPNAILSEQIVSNNAIVQTNGQSTGGPTTVSLPGCFGSAKIETVTENTKAQSLSVQQIADYCKPLFNFKKIRVMRFK